MWKPSIAIPLLITAALAAQDDAPAERKLATIPDGLTEARSFAFGAGGQFVAYLARRGGKSVAMVGDQELGEFDYLHPPAIDVTRNHYAFRAGNRKNPTTEEWWAIVDGKKSKTYAWIGEVAIGARGDAAFWEQPGAKIQKDGAYNNSSMVLHVGKKKGKKFEQAMSLAMPSFSTDGKTVASAVLASRQWFAITATTRKEKVDRRGYPAVEDVAVSPDGKKTAAVVVVGGMPLPPGVPPPPGVEAGKMRIASDGKLYGDDTDGAGAPVFAPDGKHFVFKFVQGAKMGLAFDDEKSPKAEYEFVGLPVFDDKGTNIAFATNTGGKIDPTARLQRWGDGTVKGGTWSLYTRKGKGKPEPLVEGVDGIAHPTFGPGGQLAYAQRARGRWYMMVGDRRSEGFEDVGPPHWSNDGKRIEFGARRDRELVWYTLELK